MKTPDPHAAAEGDLRSPASALPASALPSPAPAPSTWALFLDLDGTLLDLAPTPEAARPVAGLVQTLAALERMTDGALALVTGRAVGFVDQLFPGRQFTVAGLHGATLRPSPLLRAALPDGADTAEDDPALDAARDRVRHQAQSLPGVLFEDKGRAFALHYRQAPDCRDAVTALMQAAAQAVGAGYLLRPGKCVLELCPAGQDKGSAVGNLMRFQPFQGRYPVAAGDDLTDEAMFRAVNAMGGHSVRVGPPQALAQSAALTAMDTPAAFRRWLKGLTR